jgi:ribosome-binding factor A
LVQRELGAILAEGHIKDPRIGFPTITRVEVSKDLKLAHVAVSVLGDEKAVADCLQGLESAAGYLRHELGLRIRLKQIPTVIFHHDRSLDYSFHINQMLQELHDEEGLELHDGEPDE